MATLQKTTFDDTGAITIPVGTTAQRPVSPSNGEIRYNTDEGQLEIYDGARWLRVASLDGSSPDRAIPSGTSVTTIVNAIGQKSGNIYVTDKSGNVIRTKLFVNPENETAYILIAGISSTLDHGQRAGPPGTWYTNWINTTTFGTPETANREETYKGRLWFDYDYDDICIMQGFQDEDISGDYFGASTEIAYTNSGWLNQNGRGRSLSSFLSGNGGPDLSTTGGSGRTLIGGLNFIKGSAQESKDRYRSGPVGELVTSNQLDFGRANCENQRMAVINALGCRSDGCNIEHHAWTGNQDMAVNYSNRNFSEPNWSSTWGINSPTSNNWMYWLWWAKS